MRCLTLVAVAMLTAACALAQAPSHAPWNALLQRHVTADGLVDYQGFGKDSVLLDDYLNNLQNSKPSDPSWTTDERKAFWINAYNAFTVRLVMRHYPLASIRDIGSKPRIPFVNTPWDIHFIKIEGEDLDLNNVEHRKLRAGFGDPRIHFAIVCASTSCPQLSNQAYRAQDLDVQLDQAARAFLNDRRRNEIDRKSPKLSKIFEWYKGDFTADGSLIAFVNRYGPMQIDPKAKLRFLPYDWSLNRQQ